MKQHDTRNLFSVTEVQLVYRNKVKRCDRLKVEHSRNAYEVFMLNWEMDRIDLLEQFKVMLLDVSNACIGISEIATGGISQCPVDLRIVMATALKARASGIILAHNHPSRNTTPSTSDIALTRKACEMGTLMDIRVIEHLIVTPESYYSFADEGLIPF